MKKSEKKMYQEQIAAELRRQQDEERIAKLEASREKQAAFEREMKELNEKDDKEQLIRDNVLKKIIDIFQVSIDLRKEYDERELDKQEWFSYLCVDGGPDPRQAPQLTTALHRWSSQPTNYIDFQLVLERDLKIHPIMLILDEIIKYPDNLTANQLNTFKEVSLAILKENSRVLEGCTLCWARAARSGECPTKHFYKSQSHSLGVWLTIPSPCHMPRAHEPPSLPIDIDFNEFGVSITLPGKRSWRCSMLRVIWQTIDRLSNQSPFLTDPKALEETRGSDLYSFTKWEYEKVVTIRGQQKKNRKDFFGQLKGKIDHLQNAISEDKAGTLKGERIQLDSLIAREPDPTPLPRELLINEEAEEADLYVKSVHNPNVEGIVNLRSHRPCGGVLDIQLFHQPLRPKVMKDDVVLTILETDERLQALEFIEDYSPPVPVPPGTVRTPEEIEADIRKQEAALDKLILIHVQLPETVLWLEPPIVCSWIQEKQLWTTSLIHDVKYNEDKFTLNFRTGELRPIAFATPKYSNLPYQGWELKPNDDKFYRSTGITISIIGAIIVLELDVSQNGITVKSIQNGATNALQDLINTTVSLRTLIKRLQNGGVDLFPSEDALTVVDGCCSKLVVLERHMYHCMAHLCIAYNFMWSRWNVSSGRRAAVQQIREYVYQKREQFEVVHCTPLQAAIVQATEVSPEYSAQPQKDFPFYPDLYSLTEGQASEEAKQLIKNVPWKLVEAMKDLLWSIRPFSYS